MMCFRCEYRAKFFETEHGPRYECQQPTRSVQSCYMFLPCFPIVLEKANKDDPRMEHCSAIISARSRAVELINPQDDKIKLVKTKSGFLTWAEK
jgi:hypothetical protein